MFGRKKNKSIAVMAPVTGKTIPITEVEDQVFSDKILGDGVAMVPQDDNFYAPCDGTVVQVAHTYHAICIETNDGLELLLHLGMDTVQLEGEGFTAHVKTGQKVKAGDKLVTMDRAFVEEKGFTCVSPFIVTNLDSVKDVSFFTGSTIHGETKVIEYTK